jgi:plasmid stabilization system protein ParE
MDWQVVFSTRSKADLQKIVEHIARDDRTAAERFGLLLIEQAQAISHAPEGGVRLAERPGTRFFPCGSYLIIYRAETFIRTVRILRFWHGARGRRPLR